MVRWRAPGRVNLVGEHTDYNDGFTLPFALAAGCTATVTRAGAGWSVRSAQQPADVVVRRTGLAAAPEVPGWSRYVLGALWLLHDRGVDVPPLRVEVDGDVPLGAGLASSAALVCSVVTAVDDALALDLGDAGLLALSREVENRVVGAPTGGMDQLVSLRAEPGHALLCDMRDLTTRPVPFDPGAVGLALLVVDTRAPHRHADGEYAARRRGCERAAAALGVATLRDVDEAGLDVALGRLPDVDLRRHVRHVVTENARVLRTADLLGSGRLAEVGPVLDASHESMREDFRITVPEVDTAVAALRAAGALGARMTGGGFGGCVIGLLPHDEVGAAVAAVGRAATDAGFPEPVAFVATAGPGARRLV